MSSFYFFVIVVVVVAANKTLNWGKREVIVFSRYRISFMALFEVVVVVSTVCLCVCVFVIFLRCAQCCSTCTQHWMGIHNLFLSGGVPSMHVYGGCCCACLCVCASVVTLYIYSYAGFEHIPNGLSLIFHGWIFDIIVRLQYTTSEFRLAFRMSFSVQVVNVWKMEYRLAPSHRSDRNYAHSRSKTNMFFFVCIMMSVVI